MAVKNTSLSDQFMYSRDTNDLPELSPADGSTQIIFTEAQTGPNGERIPGLPIETLVQGVFNRYLDAGHLLNLAQVNKETCACLKGYKKTRSIVHEYLTNINARLQTAALIQSAHGRIQAYIKIAEAQIAAGDINGALQSVSIGNPGILSPLGPVCASVNII